jgi:hypothetical protein
MRRQEHRWSYASLSLVLSTFQAAHNVGHSIGNELLHSPGRNLIGRSDLTLAYAFDPKKDKDSSCAFR